MAEQIEDKFTRFKGAEWFGENNNIIIGGAGGIGSWLSFFLSKIGNNELHIYDNDSFEQHNLAGQLVRANDMGKNKAVISRELINQFGGSRRIYCYNELYREQSPSNEIMFACFDNMEARKVMFNNWKKMLVVTDPGDCLFVDLRLSAESWTILIIQGDKPEQIGKYEKEEMFTDEEVIAADCTFKQTSHSAAMIGSHATGLYTNWLSNKKMGVEYRAVPYRSDYMIALNYFTNE